MDGFNSKEFYGHSFSEDPRLRTTTRNYEFKYNSSDHLERIINRVRMDREKKNEMDLLSPNHGQVKFHNRYTTTEKSHVVKIPNVETQIGSSKPREAIVKIMSDEEIEDMIALALQSTDDFPIIPEINSCEDIMLSKESKNSDKIQKNEEIQKEFPLQSVEVLPDLQPQWVQIKPVQKSVASLHEVHCVDSDSDEDSSYSDNHQSALNLDDEQKMSKKEDEMPKVNKTSSENQYFDSLSFGSVRTEDFIIRNEDSVVLHNNEGNCDGGSPPESLISLDIESNLNESEHLEIERVFHIDIPHVPKMQFESLDMQDNNEHSEYSDEEDEREDARSQVQENVGFEEEEFNTQSQAEEQVQNIDDRRIQNLSFRSRLSSPPKTSRSIKKAAKSHPVGKPLSSKRISPSRRTPAEVRSDIPIEDLKQEKLRIFSKMTSIQEKIITSLDALRISLVEISLPDGEIEVKLRERNALEFSVRFSRNYLFPLGKMIDDLRLSPKEQFCSALTNEPCVKVCGIYGLLSQAIQCYQKQLRHFFTDCVPKKLDSLLNLIKDATIICLEKQIFDKRDTLIQCLVARCDMFLELVMEFAEKKKSARSDKIALQSERRSRYKLPKTSSKWDLTMNLNNLNMYEPKLVAKKTKQIPQKKPVKPDSQRGITSKIKKKPKMNPKNSADHVALPMDDSVETQVRRDNTIDSVQLINDAIAEEPESELAKAVIETLQDITKDEVHQMFGSIVLNLESILKSSDNPQKDVESVLNVLKSKFQEAKGKQLKIDEIATENSTQNSNSYQKEVTKKGTHSSKGEQQQQQQQFKENRQNKVSKAKAKVVANCSNKNNVKEDSTEQTERYSRSELTDTNTICDKQSLSNIDVVAAFVSENNSKKCSGAFLSTRAMAAKKPTPQPPDTIEVGGIAVAAAPPPSTPLLPIKLDDVMPPPPQLTSRYVMTSEKCLDYSSNPLPLPVGLSRHHRQQRGEKFVSENDKIIIGDGKHRNEDVASQRNVRDGAANAIDRAEDNQKEARRKNLPAAASSSASPVRNEAAMLDEIEKLYYRKNALYTFLKYLEKSSPSANEEEIAENSNENSNNVNSLNEIIEQEGDNNIQSSEEVSLKCPIDTLVSNPTEIKTNEEDQTDIDIKAILNERKDFIERCKNDPFYCNPQFPQPWKVLSKISKVIAREIVESFENDLSFGEESYIRDFIDMEVQT